MATASPIYKIYDITPWYDSSVWIKENSQYYFSMSTFFSIEMIKNMKNTNYLVLKYKWPILPHPMARFAPRVGQNGPLKWSHSMISNFYQRYYRKKIVYGTFEAKESGFQDFFSKCI